MPFKISLKTLEIDITQREIPALRLQVWLGTVLGLLSVWFRPTIGEFAVWIPATVGLAVMAIVAAILIPTNEHVVEDADSEPE